MAAVAPAPHDEVGGPTSTGFQLGLLPPELLDNLAARLLPKILVAESDGRQQTSWRLLLRFSAVCAAARAASARAIARAWPVLLLQGDPPAAQLLAVGRQLGGGEPCHDWQPLRPIEWTAAPQRHHPRPRGRSGASLVALGPTALMVFGGRLSESGETK
jgi:hypothetical protein